MSLLRQRDAVSMEIVVVNDGSTDETGAILQKMAQTHQEIKVIEVENGGVTRARNLGLQHMSADADLVSFLDADDLSPQGRLANDVKLFEQDPELDLVYSAVQFFRDMDPDNLCPAEGSDTLDIKTIQLGACVAKASLIRKLNGFDEGFIQSEDTDFLLRMWEREPKYIISDNIGVYYRQHNVSLTSDRRVVIREFCRALLQSSKRRKNMTSDYLFPKGIFDLTTIRDNPEWMKPR